LFFAGYVRKGGSFEMVGAAARYLRFEISNKEGIEK